MTYRGLPADYDAWKTRSDRDDDWWNEPEPEDEDDMAEPADIAALVERLRNGAGTLAQYHLEEDVLEAADALEALQADIERLGFYGGRTSVEAAHEIAALQARAGKAEAELANYILERKL